MNAPTVFGEPAVEINKDVYVVTYPERLSEQAVETIFRCWEGVMGSAKLIILDSGAQITRLTDVEATPIYDALLAERQAS